MKSLTLDPEHPKLCEVLAFGDWCSAEEDSEGPVVIHHGADPVVLGGHNVVPPVGEVQGT